MRTVSSDVMTDMTDIRKIGGQATFRDTRLNFVIDDWIVTYDDVVWQTAVGTDCDIVPSNNSILRVCSSMGSSDHLHLWWNNYNDLDWNDTGINLKAGSSVAVYQNRVFYHGSDGWFYYRDFNPVAKTFGSAVEWSPWPSYNYNYKVAFAPVNSHEVYILWQEAGTPYIHSVSYRELTGATLWDGVVDTWHGVVYGTSARDPRAFDAERLGSSDYIFVTDMETLRAQYIKRDGGNFWSDMNLVVPLDIVDDTSSFKMGGVSLVNGKLVVSGILRRPQGLRAHVYMMMENGDHFTMGREFYIGNYHVDPQPANPIYKQYQDWGGKLIYSSPSEYIYYFGMGVIYGAPATMGVGDDNAIYKAVTPYIENTNISQESNSPERLAMDMITMDYGGVGQFLLSNREITLELGYGGHLYTHGVYEIDAILMDKNESGASRHILGRSKSMRRLSQWSADADYDYWSQTKQSSNASDLATLLRLPGSTWGVGVNGGQKVNELNVEAIAYSVADPMRNGAVEAVFQEPYGSPIEPRHGVIINYYRESQYEAATRLGIPVESVKDNQYGDNGIYVIYGPHEHNGGAGFSYHLKRVLSGGTTWQLLSSTSYTSINPGEIWRLKAQFHEGRLQVSILRPSVNSNWINLTDFRVIWTDFYPWKRDQVGRGAILVENKTPNSACYGFDSDSMTVGVDDASIFSHDMVVRTSDEVMTVDGISTNTPVLSSATVVEGYTFKNASWANSAQAPFTGYEIYLSGVGTYQLKSYYDGKALVVVSGQGAGTCFKITGYDYSAPCQWHDTHGSYTLPDTWMDHVGNLSYGHWEAAAQRRIFVDRDPLGIVGPDSVVKITPAVYLLSRGDNGTIITTHTSGLLSQEDTLRAEVSLVNVFSGNIDMSFEDMATEIATKAGVQSVSFEKILHQNLTFSRGSWDQDADLVSYGHFREGSSIMKFRLIDLASSHYVGMVVRPTEYTSAASAMLLGYDGGKIGLGWYTGVTPANTPWASPTQYILLPESVGTQEVVMSVYKEFYSCWIGGRLIGTFIGPVMTAGAYVGPTGYGGAQIHLDWSELDMRVDNFILDRGKQGPMLMDRLIHQKHIYYQDDQYGAMRFFRTRATLTGSYDYQVSQTTADNQAEVASRVRLEGAELWEEVDYTLMGSLGNVFMIQSNEELDVPAQFHREAEYILANMASKAHTYSISGALDPRLEANDVIPVVVDGVTTNMIVDAVTLDLALAMDDARLDMEVTARNA